MIINIQDDILKLHAWRLLDRLLQDKTTKANILWATDAYSHLGDYYSRDKEIRPQRITGENSDLIKTRARREMEQRNERTRQHAEVFTPLWVVKKMNDVADEQWFGRKQGIYKLTDEGKIYFTKDKHWKLYVDARRLEITCGEAPFLATRYDVETGEAIPVEDRIGLLDRKLRAVSENAKDIDEWKTWALRAVQAIYGYELQGDNLLIARVNILFSVEEHMWHRWKQIPDKAWLEKLCNVICWNLWQMDGIRGCIPVPPPPAEEQLCLFSTEPLFEQETLLRETTIKDTPCRLKDWRREHSFNYDALRKRGSKPMKFDFIIGNPPYQEEKEGTSDSPIYNYFMDAAYELGEKVEMITPARFLFGAGKTPKQWNEKMLSDEHLKVNYYEQNSAKVFANTDIMGGIAVTYRDSKKRIGPIEVFTSFPELNCIRNKVTCRNDFASLSDWVYAPESYKFSEALHEEHPEIKYKEEDGENVGILSKGHDYDVVTNIFSKLPEIFVDEKSSDNDLWLGFVGLVGNNRFTKWVKRIYIRYHENLDKYKVFLPKSNGSGSIGEGQSTPLIGQPIIGKPSFGHTQSFISIGALQTEQEANNLLKYIKTKFTRTMIGILKITQDNKKKTWRFVPIQDFTPTSDIDWSKSIPEIDKQLYAKYGLDEAEIAFIESHVKEMN